MFRKIWFRIPTVLLLGFSFSSARILRVGPGQTYPMPMNAAAVVQDGDTVEITAGVYQDEVSTWRANDLVLRGSAAYARLNAPALIPNGKAIWVIQGNNTTVENIEFANATVVDQNGAGIRQEGDGLIVRHCYFHDNDDGILGGGSTASNVIIEYSEFADNGFGDGFSHNMYIANIGSFTLRYSSSHHARIGHLVKSRARVNHILYNRLMDEATGTASYQIDLPNGGTSYIIGNAIQQGPNQDNPGMISYGEEGLTNPGMDLYVVNNSMVNDHSSGTFVRGAAGSTTRVANNVFVGPGTVFSGTGDTTGNLVTQNPGFVNRTGYDYHLTAGSAALNIGINPGSANGIALSPVFQYEGNASAIARPVVGNLDMGAFEFGVGSGLPRNSKSNMSSVDLGPVFRDGRGVVGFGKIDGAATRFFNFLGISFTPRK